jgi:hypothetical protein
VDEAALARVEGDLIGWGLLERAPSLQLTRRFRGALMRAAAKLQAQEQASGQPPAENPVARAVEVALEEYPLPPGAVASDAHRRFLVAVEIASLPPAVRGLLGL